MMQISTAAYLLYPIPYQSQTFRSSVDVSIRPSVTLISSSRARTYGLQRADPAS